LAQARLLDRLVSYIFALPMWTLVCLLALVGAENAVTVEADGSIALAECEGDEVCLLQTRHFMRKHGVGAPDEAAHAGECPGSLVEEKAQTGKCSYSGVDIKTKDGTAITDFFDDNVQMKDFHWYINGVKNVWVNLETHPFRVGTTIVTVEGRDLAGNTRSCHRTVKVADSQRPDWTKDDVDKEVTIYVDKSCTRTPTSVFSEYESASGFAPTGKDNCGVEGVTKVIKGPGGDVIFDDSSEMTDELLRGPGTYELVYTLKDVNGNSRQHVVVLHLEDNTPPTKVAGCPEDGKPGDMVNGTSTSGTYVEVEADEITGMATWTLPEVVEDNCLPYGVAPLPEESNSVGTPAESAEPKKRKATLPVGNHEISYPIEDAFGNRYNEECKFVITVVPKAHPVKLTCPEDVEVNTYELSPFGAPTWKAPVAMQGNVTLPDSHITYMNGAGPGLPFIYGSTTVTVKAVGKITGERTREEEQSDECSFRVTVKDPYRPYVDGRLFRCQGDDEAGVEPYGVCDGTDLRVKLHKGYEDTGGYDLDSAVTHTMQPCCTSEMGQAFSCQAGPSDVFKYCQPVKTTA